MVEAGLERELTNWRSCQCLHFLDVFTAQLQGHVFQVCCWFLIKEFCTVCSNLLYLEKLLSGGCLSLPGLPIKNQWKSLKISRNHWTLMKKYSIKPSLKNRISFHCHFPVIYHYRIQCQCNHWHWHSDSDTAVKYCNKWWLHDVFQYTIKQHLIL